MADYERNVVFWSSLTGQFFYAAKARVLSPTLRIVVGRKHDVTAQLQPFLLKRYRLRKAK